MEADRGFNNHFEAVDPAALVKWRGRPRFKNPLELFKQCTVEADRGFNNDLAGDSGFGRPVKRGTRPKDPLKQSASPQTRCGGGDRRYGGTGNTALAVP